MRLVLGREPLTEADTSARPAVCRLCEALAAPTHWDEETETLYINSPFPGRKVRVETGTPGEPSADSLVTALRQQLTRAGIDLAAEEPELSLRVDVTPESEPGISAAYSWAYETALRRLASSMAWIAGQQLGLPVRTTEPIPGSETPHITLDLSPSGSDPLSPEPLVELLLDTLHSHWSPPEVPPEGSLDDDRIILDPDPDLAPPEGTDEEELAQVLGTVADEPEPDFAPGAARLVAPMPGPVPEAGRTVPVVASFRRVSVSRSSSTRLVPAETALPFQRAFPPHLPPEARVELPPPSLWRTQPEPTPEPAQAAPPVPDPATDPGPVEAAPPPPQEQVLQVVQIPQVLPNPEPQPEEVTPAPVAESPLPTPVPRRESRTQTFAQVITNNGVIIRIQK